MTIGDHPALEHLHDLELRARGVIGSFHTDGTRVIEQPPFAVGPGRAAPAAPASPAPVAGRHVVAEADGSERTVDTRLDDLPIDPTGDFVAAPMSDSAR